MCKVTLTIFLLAVFANNGDNENTQEGQNYNYVLLYLSPTFTLWPAACKVTAFYSRPLAAWHCSVFTLDGPHYMNGIYTLRPKIKWHGTHSKKGFYRSVPVSQNSVKGHSHYPLSRKGTSYLLSFSSGWRFLGQIPLGNLCKQQISLNQLIQTVYNLIFFVCFE